MSAPSAEDMAEIIWSVGEKLLEARIIDDQAITAFSDMKSRLMGQKGENAWSISVDRGQPITFAKCLDDKGESIIIPKIVAKGITVKNNSEEYPPFDALDIALEIEYEGGAPLVRWHIDKANKSQAGYQDGPLFHIQLGGHHHDNRGNDLPIKKPRWNHPPLDIVLFCELVAANFFPDEWLKLREDPAWCEKISLCEKYCYEGYIAKLTNVLNTSSRTILGEFWAT